jgi:hypothetical protein
VRTEISNRLPHRLPFAEESFVRGPPHKTPMLSGQPLFHRIRIDIIDSPQHFLRGVKKHFVRPMRLTRRIAWEPPGFAKGKLSLRRQIAPDDVGGIAMRPDNRPIEYNRNPCSVPTSPSPAECTTRSSKRSASTWRRCRYSRKTNQLHNGPHDHPKHPKNLGNNAV